MNTKKMITPNNYEAAKKTLKALKDFNVENDLPEEIREDEAHLTHLLTVRSSPNMKTFEFEHNTKIIKLTEQALATTKALIGRDASTLVVLHDGSEYTAENKNKKAGKTEAKKDEDNGFKKRMSELEEENRQLKEAAANNVSNSEAKKDDLVADRTSAGEDAKATQDVKNEGENAQKKATEAGKADKVDKK